MRQNDSGIPGYEFIDASTLQDPTVQDWTQEQWELAFASTRASIVTFMEAHDPFAVLAKTAMQYMALTGEPRPSEHKDGPQLLEQFDVEITQAFLLMSCATRRRTPISPGNFERYWLKLRRHIQAFYHKQPALAGELPVRAFVAHRARLQTLYQRNNFVREDCEQTMLAILTRLDQASLETLDCRLSDAYRALLKVLSLVEERFFTFVKQINNLVTAKDVATIHRTIHFFETATPMAGKLWRRWGHKFTDIEELRIAGYQLSEMANAWVYTLPLELLAKELPERLVSVLNRLSIEPGELRDLNPEHIYLANPVWQRPLIRMESGDIFAALPQMPISFPFAIVEGLVNGQPTLEKAYERARAMHLEAAIAGILRRSLPSASVYEGVTWIDPETGTVYENDVAVLIGNTIFLFEAKAGRIADPARRGGLRSLERNFKDLFIRPAEQAARLQIYLDTRKEDASLRVASTGEAVQLRMDRPKTVHKFSICMEHFGGLTSSKGYLRDMGLVSAADPWAPVLSLGELLLLERFLDTEISFFHYLTRRATIEDVFNFDGDEQDLLSMYLSNGMFIDAEAVAGRRVSIFNSDSAVRTERTPRENRRETHVYGVPLSPMWLDSIRNIYERMQEPHRFDIIQAVLNQDPAALAELERHVRRWQSGASGKDSLTFIYREIASQRFAVIVCLMKKMEHFEVWKEHSRNLAHDVARSTGALHCAVFLQRRKSKDRTFDAVSFYRLKPLSSDLPSA